MIQLTSLSLLSPTPTPVSLSIFLSWWRRQKNDCACCNIIHEYFRKSCALYFALHVILNPQLTNQSFSFCTAEQPCNVLSLSLRHYKGGEGVLCSFVASWWSLLWRVWGVGASTVIANRLFLRSRSTKGAMMCPSWPVAFYCDGESAEQRWCRGIPQGQVGQVQGGGVIDIVRWWDVVILYAWISKLSTYGIQT